MFAKHSERFIDSYVNFEVSDLQELNTLIPASQYISNGMFIIN